MINPTNSMHSNLQKNNVQTLKYNEKKLRYTRSHILIIMAKMIKCTPVIYLNVIFFMIFRKLCRLDLCLILASPTGPRKYSLIRILSIRILLKVLW